MKVYAVISKLYNQDPNHLIFFDSLDKAKNFLQEMASTYKQDCVHWHKTKELFKVSSFSHGHITDKFYIEKYEVH